MEKVVKYPSSLPPLGDALSSVAPARRSPGSRAAIAQQPLSLPLGCLESLPK